MSEAFSVDVRILKVTYRDVSENELSPDVKFDVYFGNIEMNNYFRVNYFAGLGIILSTV